MNSTADQSAANGPAHSFGWYVDNLFTSLEGFGNDDFHKISEQHRLHPSANNKNAALRFTPLSEEDKEIYRTWMLTS